MQNCTENLFTLSELASMRWLCSTDGAVAEASRSHGDDLMGAGLHPLRPITGRRDAATEEQKVLIVSVDLHLCVCACVRAPQFVALLTEPLHRSFACVSVTSLLF